MWSVVSGALSTVSWVLKLGCQILGAVDSQVVDKVAGAVPSIAGFLTSLF